ncbi:hypothetical protein Tco_0486994 [Tanacetum coccineum]
MKERHMQSRKSKLVSSKALDASLVVTECSGTKSDEHITSSSSGTYITHGVDADIRPVNDQVPSVEVHLIAQHNVLANEQHHTDLWISIFIVKKLRFTRMFWQYTIDNSVVLAPSQSALFPYSHFYSFYMSYLRTSTLTSGLSLGRSPVMAGSLGIIEHEHVVMNSTPAGMRHHHLHLYVDSKETLLDWVSSSKRGSSNTYVLDLHACLFSLRTSQKQDNR